jgi:phthiodiolone/phenolphthiodiolone dimycocerosates ketoreductase
MLPPARQAGFARFLEALGFQQLWAPDHLLFPDLSPAFDAWTVLSVVASRTRSAELGPAVTDPYRTHPAALALRIATLDQLSRGRFVLGLGSGEAMNLEAFGFDWQERKVGRLKEFLTVLRGLLDGKEPFTFEGEFYRTDRARLSVRPYKNRRVPIYMAALGPMMQRLAGRRADGWMPTLIPPQAYRDYFQPMAESARQAGRDPESLARVATVAVAIDTDGQVGLAETLEHLRPLSGLLVWAPVMERLGLAFDPPARARSSYLEVNPCDPESQQAYWEMERWMPAAIMEKALSFGSAEDIYQACAAYVGAGATHLQIAFPALDPLGNMIVFAHQVLPRLTGRPPTAVARGLGALLGPLIRRGALRKRFPARATPLPTAPPEGCRSRRTEPGETP